MALKDRIYTDIHAVFLRDDHFAETHYWNGHEILCVPDEEEAIKRKNNYASDVSWDNNAKSLIIHTSLDGFPGGEEPEPNTHVLFDKRPMLVIGVYNNMGMLNIQLTALEPREMM